MLLRVTFYTIIITTTSFNKRSPDYLLKNFYKHFLKDGFYF